MLGILYVGGRYEHVGGCGENLGFPIFSRRRYSYPVNLVRFPRIRSRRKLGASRIFPSQLGENTRSPNNSPYGEFYILLAGLVSRGTVSALDLWAPLPLIWTATRSMALHWHLIWGPSWLQGPHGRLQMDYVGSRFRDTLLL